LSTSIRLAGKDRQHDGRDGKRRRISADNLPSNLHSLSADRLRAVCAAQGLLPQLPVGATKKDMLELLEDCLLEEAEPARIAGAATPKTSAPPKLLK
jgi:hypothetical protein